MQETEISLTHLLEKIFKRGLTRAISINMETARKHFQRKKDGEISEFSYSRKNGLKESDVLISDVTLEISL